MFLPYSGFLSTPRDIFHLFGRLITIRHHKQKALSRLTSARRLASFKMQGVASAPAAGQLAKGEPAACRGCVQVLHNVTARFPDVLCSCMGERNHRNWATGQSAPWCLWGAVFSALQLGSKTGSLLSCRPLALLPSIRSGGCGQAAMSRPATTSARLPRSQRCQGGRDGDVRDQEACSSVRGLRFGDSSMGMPCQQPAPSASQPGTMGGLCEEPLHPQAGTAHDREASAPALIAGPTFSQRLRCYARPLAVWSTRSLPSAGL